ncbi:MAG TPA: glycosyltransferase N-terminal domain-containing protein [Bacteroidia bacterium]|nr:glycosyltransferase N-terminal domain-containing protein [Bacteroidia bacterium]
MRPLYSFNILMYGLTLRFASLFHAKARQWITGRKNLFTELEKKIAGTDQPVVWFHCASLGEFEQGRPLIEQIKKRYPGHRILLTFFSPSGYEVRKNYEGADVISYLPLDTPANARRFIRLVKPKVVFFIKYEFWLNMLALLRENTIPHYLVSAIFREKQVFFKPWGGIFRDALKGFTFIFTQENKSINLLQSIGITHAEVSGDTRFDRVAEIAANAKQIPLAEKFAGAGKKVIVAGSTWPQDEAHLFPAICEHLTNGWKLLIAPHELNEARLSSIESALEKMGVEQTNIQRFSKANEKTIANAQVLLIDNMGMLSSLYRYGRIAYIGGGFGRSIHNTLEAAVYGIPVIFGPRFEKFNEAKGLIARGGGFSVSTGEELNTVLNTLMRDEKRMSEAGKKAGEYVIQNKGATEKILAKAASAFNH